MFSISYLLSIVVAFNLMDAEHIQIIPSFFAIMDILAKYKLMLGQIISLSNKN